MGESCSKDFSKAQDALVGEFQALGDILAQYTYLVNMSADLAPMTEDEKSRAVMVDKCQSQVWILPLVVGAGAKRRLTFRADSDTLIIRGALACMLKLIEGLSPEDIACAHFDFVQRTELEDAFSDERLNGFAEIERTIHDMAQCAMDGQSS